MVARDPLQAQQQLLDRIRGQAADNEAMLALSRSELMEHLSVSRQLIAQSRELIARANSIMTRLRR
ncbi:MAG: hypothetical protein JO000_22180 [Alphaproteobacteria bacterium]|nr:hypothetical protein [Alphaproteobacteria bacterium]